MLFSPTIAYCNYGKASKSKRKPKKDVSNCRRRHFLRSQNGKFNFRVASIFGNLLPQQLEIGARNIFTKEKQLNSPCFSVLSRQIMQLNFQVQELCTIPQGQRKNNRAYYYSQQYITCLLCFPPIRCRPILVSERKKNERNAGQPGGVLCSQMLHGVV